MLLRYLVKVGSATSQLANVVFLGGSPNESISGRSHRCGWRSEALIDTIFGRGHCKASYLQDAVDAHAYLLEYRPYDRA